MKKKYTKMQHRNLYQTKVTVNGKPKPIYAKTIKELEAKRDKLRRQANHEYSNFQELADEWMEYREKMTDNNRYRHVYHHLSPILPMPIEKITLQNIQGLADNMFHSGYAKRTIKSVLDMYSMIIKYGILNGCSFTNYRSFVKINPKATQKEVKAISKEQEELIIKNIKTANFGFYAFLLLHTGLRRGEALALQWKDIDFKNNLIHIEKAVAFDGNSPILKPPKTKKGIRDVPIIDNLLPYLKELKSKNKDDFIFGGEKPFAQSKIRYKWNKYCEEMNFNITQHQLRHTFCTYLYYAGIGLKEAQYIMGHEDSRTTLDIYTSLEVEHKENSRQKLNNFFNNSVRQM